MQRTPLYSARNEFLGVWFTLPGAPSCASYHVEAARQGRVRLVAGGASVLWARMGRRYEGVSWLRKDDREAIVPPIRAEAARAAPATDREAWEMYWIRFFLEALAASSRSPLDRGVWELRSAVAKRPKHVTDDRVVVHRLAETLEQRAHGFERWYGPGINGSGAILARRPPSPEGDGRVKMWRKLAREGTMPAVLLMFVTALDMHVLIDGHDRLHAALLEGTSPAMLTLLPVTSLAHLVAPKVRDAVTREYVRRLEDPRLALTDAIRLGTLLSNVHGTPITHQVRTRAFPVPGGPAAWDREVGAAFDRLAPSADRGMLEAW